MRERCDFRRNDAGAWHRPHSSLRRVRGDAGQHHRLLDRRSVFRSSIRGETGCDTRRELAILRSALLPGNLIRRRLGRRRFSVRRARIRSFVYGRDAAAILGGDGSFGGFVQCCGCIVPHAKLAVHEQFPDQVAATIQNFLLGP